MSLSPGDSQDTVILTCVLLDSEMTAVRLLVSLATKQIGAMNKMLNGRCIAIPVIIFIQLTSVMDAAGK